MIELQELHGIVNRFLQPMDLAETSHQIIAAAQEVSGATYGSLYLWQHRTFVRLYSNSPAGLLVKPRRLGRLYQAYLSGKSLFFTGEQRQYFHPESDRGGIKFECLVPLRNENKSIGGITLLFKNPPRFNKSDLFEILELVCSTGVLAIRKAQLYADLKESIRSRDLFISVAAHELRTPLTTILGATNLIKKRVEKKLIPKAVWPELIEAEALRMSRLVNELLVVQQIETGRFAYVWKNYDLLDIARLAIADLSLAFPDRKVILENNSQRKSLPVVSDKDKLVQVFVNLLNNAHNWSPLEAPILFRLDLVGTRIYIDVIDSGAGIPPESLSKIFNGFYKADAISKGLGLGLYVCKRIIDRHKGTISIVSQLNSGTTVTITLQLLNTHGKKN